MLRAAADPLPPDSSQLVLSLTRKAHYLHHVLCFFHLRLDDILMVWQVLTRFLLKLANRICSCGRNIHLATFVGSLFCLLLNPVANIIPCRRKIRSFLRWRHLKL